MEKLINKPKISVCVPIYPMARGHYFLDCLLTSLRYQSFKDFEVVIADNGDDELHNLILSFGDLNISYFKNPRKGMAANSNEAIKVAKGEIIKMLYMDDSLANPKALQHIADNFKGGWGASACIHDDGVSIKNVHLPYYNEEIYKKNTIGSPSVVFFENKEPLLFDEKLSWTLDCSLYKQLYERYGNPLLIYDCDVIIGLHDGQMTHILTDEEKAEEVEYTNKKYQ